MVDLAKIRKKAKKEKQEPPAPVPEEQGIAAPTEEITAGRPVSEPDPKSEAIRHGNVSPDDVPAPALPSTSKLDKFKSEAGKRREAESGKAEAAAEGQQLELLTFVIANEHYAVDIEKIVEIVTPRSVTRIPNADATVVGILSLRGTIVTLVDVRRKLRHGDAAEPTADTRIVVIDFNNEIVGFLVDRVLRVVKAAAADIEPPPVVHATELDESVRGVFRVSDALTILLDLDKLLAHTWT
jgi:purine-binding chemotaxis protein CheW